MSVAIVLIAIALMTAAELLIAATQQQKSWEFRRAATCEASNILDGVMARSYGDVTADKLAQLRLSEDADRSLPGGKVSVQVVESEEVPRSRRVQVEIGWQNGAGRTEQVQLVAWKYAPAN